MIDLSKKTYRNILQAQLGRVPNSLDKREGSMIQTALGAGAYSLEEFYLELDQGQRGRVPAVLELGDLAAQVVLPLDVLRRDPGGGLIGHSVSP